MSAARNTATHRICRVCEGAGEIYRNDSAIGDPQDEYEIPCTADGCVDGWVRCVPVDPITQLGMARRWARFPGTHASRYGEIRARVTTDVPLPSDPLPATAWPKAA